MPANCGYPKIYGSEKNTRTVDFQADCLRMLKAELLPYRYTVIDTRTGLTEMNLSLVAQCNKIIMISTPDATSIYDTYSLIKVANSYFDDKNIFLVLNQVIDRESSLDAYRELNSTLKYFLNSGIRLLGIIPEDISVADIQNYLIQPDPGTFKSPALKIIREISSRIREFRYVGTSLRG